MHDEFERSLTGGRPRKGLSFLGWLAVGFGFFFVIGAIGVGYAVTRLAGRVQEIARDVAMDFRPGEAASEIVSRLRSHERLLGMEPEQGLGYLRTLDARDPSEALLEDVFSGSLRSLDRAALPGSAPFRGDASERPADGRRSSLTLRGDDGDVRFDLTRGDDGGSLVVRSDEGEVRFDLTRTDDGGFLTIDSDDGSARIDLVRSGDGATLTIDSDEGRVRFDLSGGEDRARLEVRTDGDEVLRLGIGDDAREMPSWVPRVDGMPRAPRPVYSLASGEGTLGGVAWRSDRPAADVIERFRALLENQGYDIRAEHDRSGDGLDGGSLWARDEGSERLVFVVAHEDADGETRVLLGYGER